MQRRRFIQILATCATALNCGRLGASTLAPLRWQGYMLGAEGHFTLYTADRAKGQNILQQCFTEIQRLETIFSLYDADSELCRLNMDGHLSNPSSDWFDLLQSVDAAHKLSGGLFDPTIQPLWLVYAQHFADYPEATQGPSQELIEVARKQTGWKQVAYRPGEIHFEHPGMQLSLNGIAQGFITDRVAEILTEAGLRHVLVELGETRAIGCHPQQRPWRLGIKDADDLRTLHAIAEIDNQALATSGSYGSPFSKDKNYHHLLHPKTGRPANRWKSLSVIAPTATQADALSTGLSFASEAEIDALISQRGNLQVLKQAS